MINSNIQRRIANTKFEANKSLFAREANLNTSEIVKILSGKIKNPGVYTIAKIAKVLNCSVNDLLGQSPAKKDYLHSEQDLFKEQLCLGILQYISEYIARNKLKNIKTGKVLLSLDVIYNFCYKKESPSLDRDFAEWVCNNSLKQTILLPF